MFFLFFCVCQDEDDEEDYAEEEEEGERGVKFTVLSKQLIVLRSYNRYEALLLSRPIREQELDPVKPQANQNFTDGSDS